MKTPAPASNALPEYVRLSLRERVRRAMRKPAAVRNVTGWNGRDASHTDSFDRMRTQRMHLAAVMTMRGCRGPGDPDACERYPGQPPLSQSERAELDAWLDRVNRSEPIF